MSTPRDLFDLPAMLTSDADTERDETDDELIDVTEGECCEGKALELRCKLCRASPTYRRRAEDGP